MRNLSKAAIMPAKHKSRPGSRKFVSHKKIERVEVAVPQSPAHALEELLVFDARMLDAATQRELLRIVPQILQVRAAWKAEYIECGCVCCHRKNPWYSGGGLCNACYARISPRMRERRRKELQGRDLTAENIEFRESLARKFNIAQRLLKGDERLKQ